MTENASFPLPPRFYTSRAALQTHFEAFARQNGFAANSIDEAQLWQQESRQLLARLLGLACYQKCEPQAQRWNSVSLERGITREEWILQTQENVWMPFYLLVPNGLNAPVPLVLCCHGHASGGGAMPAGVRDSSAITNAIDTYHGDYGLQLAKRGVIAACPDARGFGRRREPAMQGEDAILESSCHHLLLSGGPLGMPVIGMWTWDNARLLDFLQCDPRVDAGRIGCAGLSGGGWQTLALGALDDRVYAAVVSGYFYGVQESLQEMNDSCACNMVTDLWRAFDLGDLGALLAGRNLFIGTGDADPLNGASGLDNVYPQVEITQRAFTVLSGDLRHHVFEGGHKWDGERALPWLIEHLQNAA